MSFGDLPDINNADQLYRAYFRLSDGTPTESWTRKEVSEAKLLLNILLTDYSTQLSKNAKMLFGNGVYDKSFAYINSLLDRNGDRYTNTRLTINDKMMNYNVNLFNIKVGEDGEPPVDLSEFSLAFSTDFTA